MAAPDSIEGAIAVVERCFAALLAQDVDALCENYTEDYVLELPYFKPGEPKIVEGRENVRAYLGSFLGVQQMDLHLTGTNWIADESLLIAEYFCDGRFLDTGEAYANRYVGYWYLRGDRVRRLREYYNPQAPRASALDR